MSLLSTKSSVHKFGWLSLKSEQLNIQLKLSSFKPQSEKSQEANTSNNPILLHLSSGDEILGKKKVNALSKLDPETNKLQVRMRNQVFAAPVSPGYLLNSNETETQL
ncbi:hypothetical protein V6N13_027860 [Hibiscus sabdariffa]|uniref:Uncharacterized protein n=1 Tax=Hibiscus sabdariffa TaxID=183260 RepID=A0ABR2CHH8_9ROSI